MMVQYLVGLCCLRHDPEAIDVTIGYMVVDEAAGKKRDVDVTVTITGATGEISAFKASEVKHEGKPLNVAAVEQLIIKLSDMPKVTHKAIFSTSGYTGCACSKAEKYGIDLYTMLPWDRPISEDFPDFPGVGTPSEFLSHFQSNLLYWVQCNLYFVASAGPSSFSFSDDTSVLTSEGKTHRKYSRMLEYKNDILMRSTGILCMQSPAVRILNTFPLSMREEQYFASPAWPHTHTLDLVRDDAYLQLAAPEPVQLDSVTISGHLQWRKRVVTPEFNIFERVADKTIFAGAAIADYGVNDGRMIAMIFPDKGREIGIHQFQIPEKQRNMIRELKIRTPS